MKMKIPYCYGSFLMPSYVLVYAKTSVQIVTMDKNKLI